MKLTARTIAISFISIFPSLSCFAKVWSVADFGAKGDGHTLDTEAIQTAIDAAAEAGGGTVEVPAGTFLTGSIWLKDNIDFHLCPGAVLLGSPNLDDYCAADCCPQNYASPRTGDNTSGGHLLLGVGVKNVTVRGPGKIDGNSQEFFLHGNYVDVGKKVTLPDRPGQMIWFVDSKDIRISDLEIANSPYWSCFILNCERVWIRGCKVHTERNEFKARNGDGIDIDRCRFVHISDCNIDTHDDCITLRASCGELLQSPQDCEYITVSGCTLSSDCNAIRVGVGEGTVKNAVLSDLVIYNTSSAFNLVSGYTRTERGTDINNIYFSNIYVEAERLMKVHHMRSDCAEFSDIVFDGIHGKVSGDSQIWAKKDFPFKDILLRNVEVDSEFECINADVKVVGGKFKKKRIPAQLMKERQQNIAQEKKLLY